MKKIDKLKRKINNSLYDHFVLRQTLGYAKTAILCIVAGIIFAFGFSCFITPVEGDLAIVTGGVSGISQNIYLIISFFNDNITLSDVTSIAYFAINIPILVFAFFKIGKRFAIFSLLNVLVSSIFIRIFPMWVGDIKELLASTNTFGGIITRIIFGGLFTGLSSAIAFRADTSCGGIDIFSYYFSLRKSTSVGKYGIALNMIIVLTYATLSIVKNPDMWAQGILIALFAFSYQFISSLVIDQINVRNKKVQLQIITKNEHMSKVLLANFPHGSTITKGKGSYSGSETFIIYTVISSSEIKEMVKLCRRVDEHAFISVIALSQVYGNFFIKPVE